MTDMAKAGETTMIHVRRRLDQLAAGFGQVADDALSEAVTVAEGLIPPEAAPDARGDNQ